MPCYKPMLAVPKCISHETGKVQYSFREKFHDAGQLTEVKRLEDGKYYPVKALPCGKCIGCRLDYSREWAVRCTLEMQDWPPDTCWFVTLTYDDQHVPHSVPEVVYTLKQYPASWANEYKGHCTISSVHRPSNLTLFPKHLQDFIKRLRRYMEYHYGITIRFYACGEYGTETYRPHYHLIVFGLRLKPFGNDAWKSVQNGNTVYECQELEQLWPFGNVIVGKCTYETCGYVARYMLKKQKGEYGEYYSTFNIEPEFTRMSLKPGIGQKYYRDHALDIYKDDCIYLSTEKKGIKVKPPRYFDIRAADEFPGIFEQIKVERSDASMRSMIAKEEKSGLPMCDILANEEEARKFKTKILQKRSATE